MKLGDRGEEGLGTVAWILGVAVVVLPIAIALLSIPRWVERIELARGTAQDAARVVVRAPDLATGLERAQRLVETASTEAGVSRGDACSDDCMALSVRGVLERGAEVTAIVSIELPGVAVPFVGSLAATTWQARHSERVDDYRSLP